MELKDHKLLIYDGACGTTIQEMNLPAEAWGADHAGYNEYLNFSTPDAVIEFHKRFLNAGAQVVETNTFGANAVVAAEYGLEGEIERMNTLAVDHARAAIGDLPDRYVAGSVGPTTKLPTLGHIPVPELAATYRAQMRALVSAGVDALIIETCQDLLQVKTALVAAFEVLDELGRDIPVQVSVTVESTGTMLMGSRIAAVVAALKPFPIFSLGLNCATGPDEMVPHLEYLSRRWPGRVSVIPNAGIPQVVDGQAVFPLTPEELAAAQKRFVGELGVSIVGGCCGTTPDHIRAMVAALDGVEPSRPEVEEQPPSLASLYDAVEISQDIPPLLIGERMNSNGSKKFRKLLLKEDYEAAVKIGDQQLSRGAHVLDLSVAYAGRDESTDITEMVRRLATTARAPLMVDSTTPEAIEAALSLYPGRAVVNSINLEDGGVTLERVLEVVVKHGAAVVALAIGEDGMAMTVDDKLKVAREIRRQALARGLRDPDIFFDMLTFTIGSGDPTLDDAAVQTLEAIKRLKKEIPGAFTVLGVSNVSFGLPKAARKVLNSVFLREAIDAGLDTAIVDAGKIVPLNKIDEAERELCLDLIYDRKRDGEEPPLTRFIEHFETKKDAPEEDESATSRTPVEKLLELKLVAGDTGELDDLISIALERYEPIEIINQILVPAMRRVGELFGRGEMLLPFVLKSAEVMKRSVDILEPRMEKTDAGTKLKILLATVQGDVHDIGKNLVDIILSNNGFEVINLGANVPAEKIMEEARSHEVDAVGLSGLLVKSAIVMKEILPRFAASGADVPVLLGGAALTARFVSDSCVPGHPRPVVYCPDAFAGLTAMQDLESGSLEATRLPDPLVVPTRSAADDLPSLSRDNPVPEPPFIGKRHVTEIDPSLVLDKLNKQALFRGRWGYRRKELSREDYAAVIRDRAEPTYEALSRRVLEEKLAVPRVAYGYFKCHSEGDSLLVEDGGEVRRFDFPRQGFGARLCIADYFKSAAEGGDTVGFFVATIGEAVMEETRALYAADAYHDYLMLHGFAVELTDAVAEHWHEVMRDELGIEHAAPTGTPVCSCQGTRYGFGYPSCPDLGAQETVFQLIDPGVIGVTLTETMEMVPEVSTSAIVVHHPEATYFAV